MKFSSVMITKPLLKSGNNNQESCIKLFKYLLSYMGLRESSKNANVHVKNHLELCKSSKGISDEAYVQVLKQISNKENE